MWQFTLIYTDTYILKHSSSASFITGPIEKLLNNRLMVSLGRLSYSVYLVNITIMMMIESRQSVSVSPTFKLLVSKFV